MLITTALSPPVIAVGLVTKSSIAVCWSCEEVSAGGGAEIEILELRFDFFLPPPRPFPCDMVSWVCMLLFGVAGGGGCLQWRMECAMRDL